VPAGDRLLGRVPAPGPGGRSSPPATASSSAAATETKAPASRSPITGPRRTTAAARAGPQLHPGSAPAPGGTPGSPAAALVGLQHRGGLGPTADRRVAGQPDRLQQPPQRSDDVQLASRSVSHLRGSSCHRNARSPCWIWPAAPVPRQRTQRRSGSPATRSSSAYSRPSAAAITMVSDPWWIRTVSGTADRSTPRHPGGAARAAGCGGTPGSLRATGGDEPRRRASRGPRAGRSSDEHDRCVADRGDGPLGC
jgi:hypothetical protein